MRPFHLLQFFGFAITIFLIGCHSNPVEQLSHYEIPRVNHDVSFIPFDAKVDDQDFEMCDTTDIRSGRNGLQFIGGSDKLREDINTNYLFQSSYESFTGFVVVRFLVNCEGKSGRYRAHALHLNFSAQDAPEGLLESFIQLFKDLDHWKKHERVDPEMEYSKYINLKIKNGRIEHVLL